MRDINNTWGEMRNVNRNLVRKQDHLGEKLHVDFIELTQGSVQFCDFLKTVMDGTLVM